jgi:hypothetical protein
MNFIGGPTRTPESAESGVTTPFRSYFPVRYYLNDFELAVCFEPQSEPSARRVVGFPTKNLRGKYGRDAAPEFLTDEPYCPFRADVWQLGNLFGRCFGVSRSSLVCKEIWLD